MKKVIRAYALKALEKKQCYRLRVNGVEEYVASQQERRYPNAQLIHPKVWSTKQSALRRSIRKRGGDIENSSTVGMVSSKSPDTTGDPITTASHSDVR